MESCSEDENINTLENNDEQWYEDWADIPDFQFDNSRSGIKLNIPDSAKDNLLQIFEILWTQEITDLIIS